MKMNSNDPAYWMLEKGRQEAEETPEKFDWRTQSDVYSDRCYICRDPEYSLMGLPLCYPCNQCGGHVAADDCECDDCGADQRS